MYIWTKDEVEKILLQLDTLGYPFAKYRFCQKDEALCLSGKGSTAYVYCGERRSGWNKKPCAIKVIGFADSHLDRQQFTAGAEVYKQVSFGKENIIRLYDAVQLWVRLDEENRVLEVEKAVTEDGGGDNDNDRLLLQFLVMEWAEPVYAHGQLYPEALARYEEDEILKCAYEIGQALKDIHAQHMLHRDVKLENIFYSPEKKRYQLGDFGIARVTEDGMASTIAMTKGYGAPEVVREQDLYDNTADIYSYGMLLYLLWNHLQFPDSDGYYANFSRQYCDGYVLPKPAGGTEEVYEILTKMCAYDPNDRYQSMEEVFMALDHSWYPAKMEFRRAHSRTYLVLGTIALLMGCTVTKIVFPQMRTPAAIWLNWVIYGLAVLKSLLHADGRLSKGAEDLFSLGILGTMIAVLVQTGFYWGTLLLCVWLAFDDGVLSGLVSGAALTLLLTETIQSADAALLPSGEQVGWLVLLLLPMAAILLLQYAYLTTRAADKAWSKNGILCLRLLAVLLYVELFLEGIQGADIFGVPAMPAGICGLVLSGICFLRERWMRRRETPDRKG